MNKNIAERTFKFISETNPDSVNYETKVFDVFTHCYCPSFKFRSNCKHKEFVEYRHKNNELADFQFVKMLFLLQ